MKQKIIRNVLDALNGATRAIAGATEMGVEAGPKHQTAAALTTSRTALLAARNSHEAARTELDGRYDALASAVGNSRSFVSVARDLLKPTLGNQYSAAWDAAGFVGSIQVPYTVDRLKGVLESLAAYFTTHNEAQSAERNITAAAAQTLFDELCAAQSEVDSQKMVVRNLLVDRNAKFVALRARLRGLVKELSTMIGPLDARWLSFGLNMPGAQETPDVPQNVSVILIGSNAVAVQWEAAPRAEHYRVWVKVNGVDQELRSVGSSTDLDFTIEPLPSNATIDIAVSAVNNGGESGKSTVVTVTTH